MAKKKEVAAEEGDLVSEVVKHLNKDTTSAFSFDSREDPAEIKKWISTGSTLLDYAISNRRNGGIPYGRITEISGLESSGKSLLTCHMIANAQKNGALAFLLDTEGRMLEKEFLLRIGIDPKRLIISNPGTIEDSFEQVERTIELVRRTRSKKECSVLIVWDSLAATPARVEVEGTYDPQSLMGVGGKAVSLGLKKLCKTIGIEEIAWVIVNQLRYNMKVANPYMDPYVTPYGKALPFYASVRLRVLQKAKLKDKEGEVYGYDTDVRVVKNSLGPPARTVSFPIIFGYGVDDGQSIYDYLKDKGSLKKVAGMTKTSTQLHNAEFPHEEWKTWFSDNRELVLNHVEELMVKKYEDRNPARYLDIAPDRSDTAAEI
jgi:recombination protein RecA